MGTPAYASPEQWMDALWRQAEGRRLYFNQNGITGPALDAAQAELADIARMRAEPGYRPERWFGSSGSSGVSDGSQPIMNTNPTPLRATDGVETDVRAPAWGTDFPVPPGGGGGGNNLRGANRRGVPPRVPRGTITPRPNPHLRGLGAGLGGAALDIGLNGIPDNPISGGITGMNMIPGLLGPAAILGLASAFPVMPSDHNDPVYSAGGPDVGNSNPSVSPTYSAPPPIDSPLGLAGPIPRPGVGPTPGGPPKDMDGPPSFMGSLPNTMDRLLSRRGGSGPLSGPGGSPGGGVGPGFPPPVPGTGPGSSAGTGGASDGSLTNLLTPGPGGGGGEGVWMLRQPSGGFGGGPFSLGGQNYDIPGSAAAFDASSGRLLPASAAGTSYFSSGPSQYMLRMLQGQFAANGSLPSPWEFV